MLRGMPRPLPDWDTEPFWEGCQASEFLLQRCRACSAFRWPPGPMCPTCQSQDAEWVAASGRGKVYSWVAVVHPVDPILADQVPYVVGLIELDEGIRVVANVLGCEPGEVRADMPVELIFEEDGETVLPNFQAAK